MLHQWILILISDPLLFENKLFENWAEIFRKTDSSKPETVSWDNSWESFNNKTVQRNVMVNCSQFESCCTCYGQRQVSTFHSLKPFTPVMVSDRWVVITVWKLFNEMSWLIFHSLKAVAPVMVSDRWVLIFLLALSNCLSLSFVPLFSQLVFDIQLIWYLHKIKFKSAW